MGGNDDDGDDSSDFVLSSKAMMVAILCTVLSVIISSCSIYKHLANYTCPDQQRYIIRLLFTCPLYGIISLLSLRFSSSAVYFETVRDCYESLVVYTFMVLILEYAGGEGNCVVKMQGRAPLKMPFPCCCMEPRPRTVDLLRECFRGTIQFVVVKPFIGMISIIMVTQDLYFNPIYQTLMLTIYNISYTVALYYLLVFYLATKEACANYYPVSKFAAVKGIVFATYYQSMLIRCFGMSTELAEAWGDFILCVEMIFFACMLGCAFPKEPYDVDNGSLGANSGGGSVGRVIANASNVMTVTDVVADAYHNFMPAYQDYLLQREDTASIAKVKRQRKFKLPGNRLKAAIALENQLLLTGLCWGVDTCMSLERVGDSISGNGLNKHGFFTVVGKFIKKKQEENKETELDVTPISAHNFQFSLQLEVTNDHGTVPLVLTGFQRKTLSPLGALRRGLGGNNSKTALNPKSSLATKKPQKGSGLDAEVGAEVAINVSEEHELLSSMSWRGNTMDGKEVIFDSMTELEARKFEIAMSDTDSRDNQISADDSIELETLGEVDVEEGKGNEVDMTYSSHDQSKHVRQTESGFVVSDYHGKEFSANDVSFVEETNEEVRSRNERRKMLQDSIRPPLILPPPSSYSSSTTLQTSLGGVGGSLVSPIRSESLEDVAFSPFHSTLPAELQTGKHEGSDTVHNFEVSYPELDAESDDKDKSFEVVNESSNNSKGSLDQKGGDMRAAMV